MAFRVNRVLPLVGIIGLILGESPSGKDAMDGLKAASELPGGYAAVGIVGVILGLALGAGISSYFVDRGWGNPAGIGPFYWGPCCGGGVVLVLIASEVLY